MSDSSSVSGSRPETTRLLGFVDRVQGAVDKASLEMLTVAREVATPLGAEVQAAVIGPVDDVTRELLGAYGVSTVHVLEHPLLADHAPEAWAEALLQLAAAAQVTAVLAVGSEDGNEVMARAAARAGLPLAANCTELAHGEEGWQLTRQRWGGMLLEEAQLTAPLALLTIAPHTAKVVESDAPVSASVEAFTPLLSDELATVRVRERVTREEGVTLATAPVVVSGGRGVGSADGFAVLEELAGMLGGAVGCSRVATNNGWRPHSDQVGQTGTRIAPDLYIACGISGATQHWVGCMNAQRILAINTDAEAPMVTRAHYAVVGDVHDVLPAVVEELRRRGR